MICIIRKLNLAIIENIQWEESIQEFQKHWKLERQSFPDLQVNYYNNTNFFFFFFFFYKIYIYYL